MLRLALIGFVLCLSSYAFAGGLTPCAVSKNIKRWEKLIDPNLTFEQKWLKINGTQDFDPVAMKDLFDELSWEIPDYEKYQIPELIYPQSWLTGIDVPKEYQGPFIKFATELRDALRLVTGEPYEFFVGELVIHPKSAGMITKPFADTEGWHRDVTVEEHERRNPPRVMAFSMRLHGRGDLEIEGEQIDVNRAEGVLFAAGANHRAEHITADRAVLLLSFFLRDNS